MGERGLSFSFDGLLWEANAEAPWVFVTLPLEDADDIRAMVPRGPGFGSIRVGVEVGGSEWATSIFPDRESGSYVLPVKRSVRDREALSPGDVATFTVRIDFD